MDCFPDFCLACDKQTTDGLYCSQACRLADLEKAGSSAPATPLTPGSFSFEAASWASSHLGTGSGFFLPPAVDFSSYKISDKDPQSPKASQAAQSTQQRTASQPSSPQRGLSPSSSRSSLVSTMSNVVTQTSNGISEQARHELSGYVSSFDQTREWKRRSTHN
ncbi:hypothetical protein H2203_000356 [Taxawa tesnikishii (nom. ined.)]|nr:hypothetical protein H2203_000356 [Dothideales sp. JES 119]